MDAPARGAVARGYNSISVSSTRTSVNRKGFAQERNFGGASRDRTDDLIVANDALSQLSYSPTCAENCDRTFQS
jgi:hypothetical protein